MRLDPRLSSSHLGLLTFPPSASRWRSLGFSGLHPLPPTSHALGGPGAAAGGGGGVGGLEKAPRVAGLSQPRG